MKVFFEKYWIYFVLFFGTVIVLLQSPLAPYSNKLTDTDSSVYIYCAQQILDGKIMYHDIFDHKGPFLYLMNIIGLTILNGNTTGIWLIELFSVFVAVIYIYKIVMLFSGTFVSLLSSLSCLFLILVLYSVGNMPELYALPLISISLYYFLTYFNTQKIRYRDFVIITVCFVFTLLLKPNFVVVWVIGGLFVAFNLFHKKQYRVFVNIFGVILLTFTLTLTPLFLYLTATRSISDFVFSYWLFNRAYSDTTIISMIHRIWERLWFLEINEYTNVSVFVFVFIISVLVYFRKIQNKRIAIFLLFLILFTSLTLSLSSRTELYYYLLFVPILSVCFALIYDFLYKLIPSSKKLYLIIICLFLNYGAIKSIDSRIAAVHKSNLSFNNLILTIKQQTLPSDKIVVVGNECSIYSFSGRESASKYAYVSPIVDIKFYGTRIRNEYCNDIERNNPKIIIRSLNYDSVSIPRLDSILIQNYTQIQNQNLGLHECWVRNKTKIVN